MSSVRRPLVLAALLCLGQTAAHAQMPTRDQLSHLPLPGPEAATSLKWMLQGFDGDPDHVVAEIALRKVTWGDVADVIRQQPRALSAVPPVALYQGALVEAMEQAALARVAEREGLDKDPRIARRMKIASDAVLARELLQRSLAPNLTEKAMRPIYDQVIAGKSAPDEVRARIIMTKSESDASDLIARLRNQGDFGAVAKEASKDGSAVNGGDLGYMRRDQLAPEIAAVAFAMGPGQMTEFPVKSGDFWFIVKVESRRHRGAPSFEEARPDLSQDLIHAGLPALRMAAVNDSPVKLHLEPEAAAK